MDVTDLLVCELHANAGCGMIGTSAEAAVDDDDDDADIVSMPAE